MLTRKSRKKDPVEYEVTKTEDEWRELLPRDRYAVLRKAGTEPAWSGELLHVDGAGVFHCAACNAELFDTDAKFESGTGWPSFDRAKSAGTILEHTDRTFGMARTEIVCAAMWRASGPCVPRRAHRHRAAVLRELALADLRAERGRCLEGRRPSGLTCGEATLDDIEDAGQARGAAIMAQTPEQRLAQGQRGADLEDVLLHEVDRRREPDRRWARARVRPPTIVVAAPTVSRATAIRWCPRASRAATRRWPTASPNEVISQGDTHTSTACASDADPPSIR